MDPNIGLSSKVREKVVGILLKLQADEYVLYTQARNFHWNVRGAHFIAYHEFFEKQYDEIDEVIDEVAERALTLGHRALGSLKEISEKTRLKESPTNLKAEEMIEALLRNHEAITRFLRKDSQMTSKWGDEGTTDFLIALMEKHEKAAWMLRAHLQK